MTVGHREATVDGVRALRRLGGLESASAADLLRLGQALVITDGFATGMPIAQARARRVRLGAAPSRRGAALARVRLRPWPWVSGTTSAPTGSRPATSSSRATRARSRSSASRWSITRAALVRAGELDAAQAEIDEGETITEVIGGAPLLDVGRAARGLARRRGRRARAHRARRSRTPRSAARRRRSRSRSTARPRSSTRWAATTRRLPPRNARASTIRPATYVKALIELVEAGARSGAHDVAAAAFEGGARGDVAGADGLGAGHRGPHPRSVERRRRGGPAVSRGDRAAGPHAPASGARARPPALRRVAAARPPARGRAAAPAHRPRAVRRHGRPRVRGSGGARAAGDGRDRRASAASRRAAS